MKLKFIFTIHNHQPIGNFDFVFEEVYQKSYLPFLETIEKFPEIKITQHYTGILYEWLQSNHPEFIERLNKLVASGQIEILTGAYYEAILSIIPPEDRIAQIKKLSDLIFQLFNYHPEGMWLAERVWEQQIVKDIALAGIKFLPIDEAHFLNAGYKEKDLHGYFITEEQGFPLFIFPGSKKLRYTIPFAPVNDTIEFLKSLHDINETRVVLFADDGEKFGSWPGTYEHVFKNKWLETFFIKLLENKDWLETVHFTDAIEKIEPKGNIYLPSASYPEMLKWTLRPDVAEEFEAFEQQVLNSSLNNFSSFIRSGYWRNFFSKYPEANWLHKRMLRVSMKLNQHISANKDKAQTHLLAAQCNDAYWHGVFGGLYLPNLRFPVYQNLIQSELFLQSEPTYEIIDFDCDGKKEIIIENPTYNLYFKPSKGGALFELDFKPGRINFLDVVNRREEYYHKMLLKKIQSNLASPEEVKLAESIIYDAYRHGSLIDHFFDMDANPDSMYKGKLIELGNFVESEYQFKIDKSNNGFSIELWREGFVQGNKVVVNKKIIVSNNSPILEIHYKIKNLEENILNLKFGVELVYNLLAGNASDRYYSVENINLEDKKLKSIGIISDSSKLSLVDEWLKIKIDVQAEGVNEFWRLPIETVSISESGYEKLYQGSIVLPVWNITLKDEWETKILQTVRMI